MRAVNTGEGLPWGIGVPVIVITILMVVASLWFAWRIDGDLAALSLKKLEYTRETEINRELTTRNARLSAPENITRKAAVLGLFPPNNEQMRKP